MAHLSPATWNLTGAMWSCQLVTSDLNCISGLFLTMYYCCCVEMYNLIGSLVIMRDCEACALTGTFAHASRFKYRWFRCQTGLHAVQKLFMRVSGACTFVTCASPVKFDSVAHIQCLHVYHGLSSP